VDLFASLARRNPGLIDAGATLHRTGEIPPDCYVVDLDMIGANCRALSVAIADTRLLNFFEAKQFGRCPPICAAVRENGFDAALAIDMEELYALERLGVPIGHAGHLGQIPAADVEHVVTTTRPQYVTVYSLDKCHQIARVAASHGLVQPVVLRVDGPRDIVVRSLAGGVAESEALRLIAEIARLDGVRFAGFTTYPAIRFDLRRQSWATTSNFETMTRLTDRVQRELGIDVEHVNAAGNICAASVGLIAGGATHCEPGQAFVGGLVANAFQDQVEVPAMAYVTEVSHIVDGVPYVFASSWVANNTVGIWNHLDYDTLLGTIPGSDGAVDRPVSARPQQFAASDPTAFMYNAIRPLDGQGAKVGDTVVFGFRSQLYRANGGLLAVVAGLADGAPRLRGLFDRNGNAVTRAWDQAAGITSPTGG
jgi:predicted amino acid racemase